VNKSQKLKKIILGTAQFGLEYGINNQIGKPTIESIDEILDYSNEIGISILDTADVYGNSSQIIGDYHAKRKFKFDTVTKFKDIGDGFLLESWVDKTLTDLGREQLYGCLFHSFTDYLNNPNWIKMLGECKDKRKIKHIGVSIYTNEEFEKAIDDDVVTIIQLPYNLLDNYSIRGSLIKKAKQKNKIIHVRSVFLQGLFFIDVQRMPKKLVPLIPYIKYVLSLTKRYGISIETLALNYVLSNEDIDGVIVGVDSISQLQSNIGILDYKLSKNIIEKIDLINVKKVELLNPSNWK
jgi:uncharacterized protein